MESPIHDFSELFTQLGLPDDSASIDNFIAQHSPLPMEIRLADAPFWTPAQAAFLKGEIEKDAVWCAMVDTLDARMRHG